MRQLKGARSPQAEDLISVQHVADTWEVDPKTIGKWTDIIYLAFDIQIPKSGPFPMWAVQLLELCGKHISMRATLYFAETQETRRLKATEFVRKIRHLRQEGHFQQFQQFQKFQNFQPDQTQDDDQDDELETLTELAAIAQVQDEQLYNAQKAFEEREDEQIEKLASFIEKTNDRRMSKLSRRLKQLKGSDPTEADTSFDQALDVSFRRVQ
ncbi:MAG: hypothetical protein NW224_12020 [Leptolyngbyaceae cyanobacterium bins.302]|nr:hypothetical protein [Leptolyngbyaceae cyanobacterium bins.302]